MKNLRTIILSAIVAGVLIVPGMPVTADARDGSGRYHFRKYDRHSQWRGHYDRRHGFYGRGPGRYSRFDRHDYRRDVRHDFRGRPNRAEIRRDFRDIRADRRELRGDWRRR